MCRYPATATIELVLQERGDRESATSRALLLTWPTWGDGQMPIYEQHRADKTPKWLRQWSEPLSQGRHLILKGQTHCVIRLTALSSSWPAGQSL